MKHRNPPFVMRFLSFLTVLMILFGSLMPAGQVGQAAQLSQEADPSSSHRGVYLGYSTAVNFDISPTLAELAKLAVPPSVDFQDPDPDSGFEGEPGPQDVDTNVQSEVGTGEIPDPLISFDGFSNQLTYTPPDPVGDVGPDHYVAMANVHFAVYSKTGTLLFGPVPNNTLWAGFGGACEAENSGDPIVVYDQLADRWMLTQFTSAGPTYYNCVALSTTGDPTGSYYRWAFSTGNRFPDYPKYGVWPDAYYISTREFTTSFVGIGAYALNRDEMLAGDPTPGVVSFLVSPSPLYNVGDGLLPSDLDGTTLPPAGSPNFYMGSMDNGASYGAPQDALTLWKFYVDWTTPANSTIILSNTIPTAAFDSIFPCTPTSRDCIPQPGTSEKVDILSYRQRPIWRLAYRNFGTHESLVTNQSVEASTNMAGNRWYEIRDPNGTPVIYQQGTYAPGVSDGIHRWMASIAMDRDGNMAMGYSASNGSSTYPSSWYTGRLATDPLGTMPQGEGVFINGLGSQTSTASRWGDYTSMNIDPVDDCSFWYINEYYPATSATGWRLRIGAFKFPSCGTGESVSDLQVEKTGEPTLAVPGEAITYTVTATNNGPDDILPLAESYTNESAITINDVGAGTPYPSSINVGSSIIVLDVNVNLFNFSHTYPEDVNVLLAGPAGQNVLLMSDVGGQVDATSVSFTFDDAAAGYLPDGDMSLTSGTYLPTDYPDSWGDDTFPAPAPGGPYGTLLSVFNGTNPAGNWDLYVYDDTGGDTGSFSGGWSLEITLDAASVTLTDTLPTGFSLNSWSIPVGWTCDLSGQIVTCTSSSMPVGQYPFEFFGTAPANTGYITNTVEIAGNAPDPVPANNDASFAILVDTAPVALDDTFDTDEDTTLDISAPGVLGNDIDADSDVLAATWLTGPSFGELTLNANGSFQYTPDAEFNGQDSFTYQVSDGYLTDEATVEINVVAVNDAPVAVDDAYETQEDTPLVVPAPGILSNDYDVEGDFLLPSIISAPEFGETEMADDGSFVYTPDPDFFGSDVFIYSIWDGEYSVSAQVAITVTSVNDQPIVEAGEDQIVDEGQEVILVGSVTDPGLKLSPQEITEISWDLGDGTLVSGVLTVTHVYLDNGLYTVTLMATDDEGAMTEDTLAVTVENLPPIMELIDDQSLILDDGLFLTVDYHDPGVLDTMTMDIDWGDGQVQTIPLSAGSSSFDISHTYLELGTFVATVMITDKDGGLTEQSFIVTVKSDVLVMFIPAVFK